ncbi:hypothetical protein BBAD15_g11861 [Beauveria bassiana D1-5]|uniref:Uncharacterized protein n=1 Tax=Beauveria bassiana D1-5 TaxID=1245745 RepID=A0A0A2V519_BEABA|nr:hypothetical protein BBAD15_g11861 [Beauveria bassiana D1-5]
MKLYILLLAGLASASVDAESAAARCKPPAYRCDPHHNGWNVCDTSGNWVFAGRCPAGTVCKFNKENGSPYCLPRNHPKAMCIRFVPDDSINDSILLCTLIINLNHKLSKLAASSHDVKQTVNLVEVAQPPDALADDGLNLVLIDKLHHVCKLLPRAHGAPTQVNVCQHRLHQPLHLGADRHAVLRNDAAVAQHRRRLVDDGSSRTINDGVEKRAVPGQQRLPEGAAPARLLVNDAALGAHGHGPVNLGLVARRDVGVAAHGDDKLQDLQGDAAANARDEHVLAGAVDAGLGHERAPTRKPDERQGGGLDGGEVRRHELDLGGGRNDIVGRAAGVGALLAAANDEARRVLGALRVAVPAPARRQDDGLVQEARWVGDAGPDLDDDAAAVG